MGVRLAPSRTRPVLCVWLLSMPEVHKEGGGARRTGIEGVARETRETSERKSTQPKASPGRRGTIKPEGRKAMHANLAPRRFWE